ncbi:hypothetical protein PARPLA_02711 [Rhodobacteraceae bacterium THAF1]|uniref:DUF6880 family protein n=1 Tax=Palleronia sp. THAF1 TaxID=2587842 RepID=UPI000F408CB0|nr:DUF6880 family protein [Palleronia sp. THAF1]QFU08702.1 hypothetical protein FIU81_08455 [Palleronia sp. THAF1]VDC28449.1 hypothetical protein PARPLA_02711 [Rhodobacteraceae bacterium THAF1]
MGKKTLNKANLEKLGAERLAALVMDLVKGNAALQRRARLELSAAQGPSDVAADIRKRFASLRRSTSYVDWRKQRALVKDLTDLLRIIDGTVALHDPTEAFELLWAFLQLAPSIHERTYDSNGSIGSVMDDAMDLIADISPSISIGPDTLADRILDAVAGAGYGEFDGIIPATAPALGNDGLEHLKRITEAWIAATPDDEGLAQYRGYGLSSSAEDRARDDRRLTKSIILADIADAQGDVDAYIARYSAEQLTFGTIAPGVARRLLDAGRGEEAFEIVTRACAVDEAKNFRPSRAELDAVFEDCLVAMGRTEDLKRHLLTTFEETLSAPHLRQYLKLLPDFEDMEAEERALDFAETFPDLETALALLIEWPAHDRAARSVLARADDLDGNVYEVLTPAAEALDAEYPLAATLLRRELIEDTLNGGKSKRYRHAARHFMACRASDTRIEDYGEVCGHDKFEESLRQAHGRKYAVWDLLNEQTRDPGTPKGRRPAWYAN